MAEPDVIGQMIGPAEALCYDIQIEILWDQWSRTKLCCSHGEFWGDAGGVNLTESTKRAVEIFCSHEHPMRCYKATPVPDEWIKGGNWAVGDTSECDLDTGHDGECVIYPNWDEQEKRRKVIHRTRGTR